MIDVHPTHHGAFTIRDFFIHLVIVILGILIAIGLEQSVEYLHHRHQVTETRQALRVERDQNLRLSAIEAREFLRRTSYLKTNLAVLLYVRDHPHALPSTWPGTLDFNNSAVPFNESAWLTAQREGVLTYMPSAEVEDLSDLYNRLDRIRTYELDERDANSDAKGYLARNSDPSRLTPHELDDFIDRATHLLVLHDSLGAEILRLAARHHDFAPSPGDQQLLTILPTPVSPRDARDAAAERKEFFGIVNAH